MSLFHLFPVLLITLFLINSYSYPSYNVCAPSVCNNFIIKHPFQTLRGPDCGQSGFIDCHNNHTPLFNTRVDTNNWFRVLGAITKSSYTTQSIRIAHNPLFQDCSQQLFNTHDYQYFNSHFGRFYLNSDKYRRGTILNCAVGTNPSFSYCGTRLQRVRCLDCGTSNNSCFFIPGQLSVERCTSYTIYIPADENYDITHACHSCEASEGICYGSANSDFGVCICPHGSDKHSCSDAISGKATVIIVILSGIFGAAATVIIIVIYKRLNENRRKERDEEARDLRAYMDPHDSGPPSLENFLHGGSPTRYSYAQIKRYTNNFADKLGQGGFGTVYKGKLPNDCLVAVKILDKLKHSRKQFLNEVATVGRIHHMHLVRLLGYCFQGSKRALVYEFMVNGSLEKYIHGDDRTALDWKQLYSIAMGTALGIAYLHDDCRSRILHCDIKPHNVLLDANFSPKVADFGLAKLTDREESHVSLTGARGTPGYVAPEMWSKNYGPLSDKSDVYSYGMLVMEMVGGRKNFDLKATRSSKFYYPEWASKQVEMGEFAKLREGNIADEEDENMAKKLSLLGLWCIQHIPSQRPSMSKVIQMLEGSVEITILPHPFPVETSNQATSSTLSSSSMY